MNEEKRWEDKRGGRREGKGKKRRWALKRGGITEEPGMKTDVGRLQ